MPRYVPAPYGQKPLDARETFETPWRLWFDFLVRQNTRQPESVTVGSSPTTFVADSDGFYTVAGGTVSAIGISRAGSAFINIGSTAGPVPVIRNDIVQIIHSSAPTVTWFGDITEN